MLATKAPASDMKQLACIGLRTDALSSFAKENTPWDATTEHAEMRKASVSASAGHLFHEINRQIGPSKVNYRGLSKNTKQLITLFAPSKI